MVVCADCFIKEVYIVPAELWSKVHWLEGGMVDWMAYRLYDCRAESEGGGACPLTTTDLLQAVMLDDHGFQGCCKFLV